MKSTAKRGEWREELTRWKRLQGDDERRRRSVLRRHQVRRNNTGSSAGEGYSPDRAVLQYCANCAFFRYCTKTMPLHLHAPKQTGV